MKAGDVYKTSNNQVRIVLGFTPDGRVGYASRGGNTRLDYTNCETSSTERFEGAAQFDHDASPGELARVRVLFDEWMQANGVT